MTTFKQDKDLQALLNRYDLQGIDTYTKLDINGNIVEAWHKDDNGIWQDVTAIKKAEQKARLDIIKLQKELNKLKQTEKEAL